MYRTSILVIVFSTLLSFIILFALLNFADLPNKHNNGFNRQFIPEKVRLVNKIINSLPFDKVKPASSAYFCLTVPNPQWLTLIDYNLGKKRNFSIPVANNENLIVHNTFVDSPMVYLFANNVPSIMYGNLYGNKIYTIGFKSIFTHSTYLSPSSLILQIFNDTINRQVIHKTDIYTGKFTKSIDLDGSKNDHGIASDGMLTNDYSSNKLLYIEYYSNKIFCLDSNLNIVYRKNTIDTINTNPVVVKELKLKNENKVLPSNPRKMINSDCFAAKGLLFVKSELKADNEMMANFSKSVVIDIYRISNGNYISSFYIPDIENEKVKSFLVNKNNLIALYKSYLAKYQIPIKGL